MLNKMDGFISSSLYLETYLYSSLFQRKIPFLVLVEKTQDTQVKYNTSYLCKPH